MITRASGFGGHHDTQFSFALAHGGNVAGRAVLRHVDGGRASGKQMAPATDDLKSRLITRSQVAASASACVKEKNAMRELIRVGHVLTAVLLGLAVLALASRWPLH